MPITTLIDLFEAGADFDASEWLSGNLPQFDSLRAALTYALGPDFQVDDFTLGQFQDTVQASMLAARQMQEGIPPQYTDAPSIGTPEDDNLMTYQGHLEIHDIGETGVEPGHGQTVPFEIPVNVFVDREQLNDLINSNLPADLKNLFVKYPRLIEQAKKYDYFPVTAGDKRYDIYITGLYRGHR